MNVCVCVCVYRFLSQRVQLLCTFCVWKSEYVLESDRACVWCVCEWLVVWAPIEVQDEEQRGGKREHTRTQTLTYHMGLSQSMYLQHMWEHWVSNRRREKKVIFDFPWLTSSRCSSSPSNQRKLNIERYGFDGELPEASDQFHFLGTGRWMNLKGSVGLILSKVSEMRITTSSHRFVYVVFHTSPSFLLGTSNYRRSPPLLTFV
jgi:hypothetical protein